MTEKSHVAIDAIKAIDELERKANRRTKALCDIAAHFGYYKTDDLGSREWVEGLLKTIQSATKVEGNDIDPGFVLLEIAKLINCPTSIKKITRAWAGDLESVIKSMVEENERVDKEHGMLADICDLVFDDEFRAAEHGYEGVVETTKELLFNYHRLEERDSKFVKAEMRLEKIGIENKHRMNRVPQNLIEALDYLEELITRNQELEMSLEGFRKERDEICQALHGVDYQTIFNSHGFVDLAKDAEEYSKKLAESCKERDDLQHKLFDANNRNQELNLENSRLKNNHLDHDNYRWAMEEIRKIAFYDRPLSSAPVSFFGTIDRVRYIAESLKTFDSLPRKQDDDDKVRKDLSSVACAVLGPHFDNASAERIIKEVKDMQDTSKEHYNALFEISRVVHCDVEEGFATEPDDIVKKTVSVVKRWLDLVQRMREKEQQEKDLLSFRDAYIDMSFRISSAVDAILKNIRYTASDNRREELIRVAQDALMPEEGAKKTAPRSASETLEAHQKVIRKLCRLMLNFGTDECLEEDKLTREDLDSIGGL